MRLLRLILTIVMLAASATPAWAVVCAGMGSAGQASNAGCCDKHDTGDSDVPYRADASPGGTQGEHDTRSCFGSVSCHVSSAVLPVTISALDSPSNVAPRAAPCFFYSAYISPPDKPQIA
jgi:hypothetical protein